jgi:hypothetical protein
VLLVTHHGHGEEEGVNLISVRKVSGESRAYRRCLKDDCELQEDRKKKPTLLKYVIHI